MLARVAVAAVAGVAVAVGFAPLHLTALLLSGMVLLWAAVRGMNARTAWLPGLAFGLTFMGALQWWMYEALGLAPWLGITVLEAAFFAPLASAAALVWRLPAAPLWLGAIWVSIEQWRGSWPWGGMPWGRLSYAVADTPWQGTLPWLGFTGTSLLLACTTAAAASVLPLGPAGRAARRVKGPAGQLRSWLTLALVVAPVVGCALVPWDPQTSRHARIAVVQPDVPGVGNDLIAVHRDVTRQAAHQTELLAAAIEQDREQAPQFVLWPENSTAVDPFADAASRSLINNAVTRIGLPVFLAAMVDDVDPAKVRNQGIVWTPDGVLSQRYTKRHPVPFGEWIPWRGSWLTDQFAALQGIPRDMIAGPVPEPLRIGGVVVANAICFDVAYDDLFTAQLRHDAEMITVQTSNATYVFTAQLDQQYEITRLRAAASGRSLAVASTNGITAVIGPDGTVMDRLPKRTQGSLVVSVPLSTRLTPAVALGPWTSRVCLLLALMALMWSVLESRTAYPARTTSADEGAEQQ